MFSDANQGDRNARATHVERSEQDECVADSKVVDWSDDEGKGERLEAVALGEEAQHGETGEDPEHHQQHGVVDGSRWGRRDKNQGHKVTSGTFWFLWVPPQNIWESLFLIQFFNVLQVCSRE